MPVVSGTGKFNLGRDCQIVIITPVGRLDLPNQTTFSCKPEYDDVKVKTLDSRLLQASLPSGWTISIESERGSGALDSIVNDIETAWKTTGALPLLTVYQYIIETDGSQTTFQFSDCTLKLTDAGDWKSDASVKQKFELMCDRRRSV